MRLENRLHEKRKDILKRWFDCVVQTYPEDTSRFLKTKKDPFANPVGNTFLRGFEAIFDELLKGLNHESLSSFLYPIIRILAIQNFSPSKAISLFIVLKNVIREIIKTEIQDIDSTYEILEFESRIDELCLVAFDIFMECREKIYELKANEMRGSVMKAFMRAGLVKPVDDDTDFKTGVDSLLSPMNKIPDIDLNK